MSSLRSWIDRWIFDSYSATPEGLGLYRIAYALFALLFIVPEHNASLPPLAAFPNVFFAPPPGPMQLVPGFPPAPAFHLLQGLLLVSLTALLLGYRTRTASVATTILFLVGAGFSYSLGKINHGILLVLLPTGMALSNWGAAYSFDAHAGRTDRTVASWPLVLVVLVTGFAMFTAGLPKILGGWLDPSTQAAQSRLVKQVFVSDRQSLLAPLALDTHSPLLWEALDIATVCFEVGFLIAVLSPAATRLFAIGAIGFHTGVMLVMNIAFTANYIVYAAVLPWPEIARALPSLPALGRLTNAAWGRVVLFLGTAAVFSGVGPLLRHLNATVAVAADLPFSSLIAVGLAWGTILLTLVLVSSRSRRAGPAPPGMSAAPLPVSPGARTDNDDSVS